MSYCTGMCPHSVNTAAGKWIAVTLKSTREPCSTRIGGCDGGATAGNTAEPGDCERVLSLKHLTDDY